MREWCCTILFNSSGVTLRCAVGVAACRSGAGSMLWHDCSSMCPQRLCAQARNAKGQAGGCNGSCKTLACCRLLGSRMGTGARRMGATLIAQVPARSKSHPTDPTDPHRICLAGVLSVHAPDAASYAPAPGPPTHRARSAVSTKPALPRSSQPPPDVPCANQPRHQPPNGHRRAVLVLGTVLML